MQAMVIDRFGGPEALFQQPGNRPRHSLLVVTDVTDAIDTRRMSLYFATARMTAQQNTRNCAFSCGVWPGSSRFSPVSVGSALCSISHGAGTGILCSCRPRMASARS